MANEAENAITPPDDHVVTAREAIEALYNRLELQTDKTVLAAAVKAGWSSQEASEALASLRLQDARAALGRTSP